ncbi:DUF1156 domain-containing protein [Kocuria rosea]|uniref:DUF1156 domain-containing protein n=1 Tax=Kocuria rosea TaxID=1275 RepID=UPI002040AAB7|nr:DUF1156 domain-containing protein [Kocuria rosea]
MHKRKLIEVALPLEAINRESAREKSIRHGHPATLHLWWARRPLAAARAVLFAQLVDDPSSHPDKFPTEEAQRTERERLHSIIERLVVWENIRDERLLAQAHEEILKSTDGNPPPILDPFAGGGTIPLEAQRLGLQAQASDLNPVAVLINKALIEIPPKFRDQAPMYPGLAENQIRTWKGAQGLAADVRAYGQWMRDQAEQRVGHLYPKATLADGSKASVIAWIWARTVTCPNPACGISMPLVRSWWLGKKKGKEAFIYPSVVADSTHTSGRRVRFEIGHDVSHASLDLNAGTVGRRGAFCIACQSGVSLNYIREEGRARRLGSQLMAVAAEGNRRRIYLEASNEQVNSSIVPSAQNSVDGSLGYYPRDIKAPTYGLTEFEDLFTGRQLAVLTVLSDLVTEVRNQVLKDSLIKNFPRGERLDSGGSGAVAYADAVATLLGMSISRTLNKSTSICTWDSSPKMEAVRGLFARQAIPMAWDFAEVNILGNSSGNFAEDVEWVTRSLEKLPLSGPSGIARQADASTRSYSGALVSTDPPYYDNIGYSDLSDFFYVWLRRSLRDIHPDLLSTMLVPKSEELVANPYRHDGQEGAKEFFEKGFREVFVRARKAALEDFPITVYYAFKQAESDDNGQASTGWETLLDGMIHAGWAITATWPNRSELGNRMIASGANALASSIVLALRPRPFDAQTTDRRGFIAALQAELPQALRNLQHGMIAPVDLPQAAIGPGMAVFSRYARVLEADGTAMTVRSALARINEILDQVLNEQEGDFDATTRFAIAWYRQHGYGTGHFGVADGLARARNTSVEAMDREGVLTSRAGKVSLIRPADLPSNYDVLTDQTPSVWETMHHLIRVLEGDGLAPTGAVLAAAGSRSDGPVDADLVKELAFLLFSVAEKNGWTQDALAFNTLVTSWPDVLEASRSIMVLGNEQGTFEFDEDM